jgi:hypothetical protein
MSIASRRVSAVLAVTVGLVSVGCAAESDAEDGTVSVASAAKIKGGRVDCFPSCEQKEYDALTKDGLTKACADLKAAWKKPVKKPAWPGWDDKKPICIGHKGSIEKRTDCNRLVDAPGWTYCKNELMLNCAKESEPGWGPLVLVPPEGGFPEPLEPPTVTDQELKCIKQWKCPTKKDTATRSVRLQPSATAVCLAGGGECDACDGSWIVEEPAPVVGPPVAPTPQPTPVPVVLDYATDTQVRSAAD